jgi:hypothetical protein
MIVLAGAALAGLGIAFKLPANPLRTADAQAMPATAAPSALDTAA